MLNIEWREKNGQWNYANLLASIFVGEFIQGLIDRGCDNIEINFID